MKRTIRVFACVFCIGALGACSHKDANAPLSYVPADTPYVTANLEPLPADMRTQLLKQADTQLPMQVTQLRHAAKAMDKSNAHAADLLNALADEFDGRTVEQFAKRIGIDPKALYAAYGVGLSPVMRVQIADTAAFQAFIGRMEKAWGTPLQTTRLGGIDYRHVRLGQLKLEFVVAVEKKQAVLAVLPIDAGKNLLRTALGLDKPEHSLQDSGKLDKLIHSNGYQPYSVAYIDFTRLPALIAGEKDPLLKALLASAPAAAEKIPASCKADFDRIASRVPMISSGMTAMKADQVGYRINVALASDIASTFSGIHVKLPGLGGSLSAPLDLAIAFPVKEFRQFWMAQADAVAAKPFTCPALTHLNQGFAKLRMAVQKTAVPPVNDLRGLQISIDSIDLPDAGKPTVAGRVLIASDNPEGMIAMAQMAVPALRTLQIPKDGKPVALPATLTRMAGGQPAWVAMNDHVLALALGSGEDQRLAESLKSTSDVSGAVSNFHMDGSMYRKWLAILSKAMDTKMKTNLDSNAANDFMKNMQQMKAQAEHVDAINEDIHVDDHGVVMNVHVKRH